MNGLAFAVAAYACCTMWLICMIWLYILSVAVRNTLVAHGEEIVELRGRVKELEAALKRIGYVVKKEDRQ